MMRIAWLVSVGILILLGFALGWESLTPVAAAVGPTGQDIAHQVQRGDDLRLIAGYYYGDTRQWERIWQANRPEVRNPNRIVPGSLLRIPDAAAPAEPYADFLARTRRPAVISKTTGEAATVPAGPAPVAGPVVGSQPATTAPTAGAPAAPQPPTPRP